MSPGLYICIIHWQWYCDKKGLLTDNMVRVPEDPSAQSQLSLPNALDCTLINYTMTTAGGWAPTSRDTSDWSVEQKWIDIFQVTTDTCVPPRSPHITRHLAAPVSLCSPQNWSAAWGRLLLGLPSAAKTRGIKRELLSVCRIQKRHLLVRLPVVVFYLIYWGEKKIRAACSDLSRR